MQVTISNTLDLDFYPTTPELVETLFKDVDLRKIHTVLEPQAGKGDIALRVKDKCYNDIDIDCVEIDPTLQNILKAADLRVVHDDFLTYETFKMYDLIIMNPPFSSGDKHLLKAINIQKRTGGMIRCILNAETIKNPYTNTRKELHKQLQELNAQIEYIPDAFLNAERIAAVEIAIIRIDIPSTEGPSILFETLNKSADDYRVKIDNQISHSDLITNIVERYNYEASLGIKIIQEQAKLKHYFDNPLLELNITSSNKYIKKLRNIYWHNLFSNDDFTGVLTSDVRNKYLSQITELKDYEFSVYNILSIKEQFFLYTLDGIESAIMKLFDRLSYQNSYQKGVYENNIHYFDGWESNKCWYVNTKVVRPSYCLEKNWNGKGVCFRYSPDALDEINDMEKVFSYFAKSPIAGSKTAEMVKQTINSGQTRNIETEYFILSFYLKGTCHIKFKDKKLLDMFNIYGARNRKWLPPSYGNTRYEDMPANEQAVVDSFQGKEAYEHVFRNRNAYIIEKQKLLG